MSRADHVGGLVQQDNAPKTDTSESRAFTIRARLLGLLSCVIVGGYAYFNDYGMKQSYLVGNRFPMAIYATCGSSFLRYVLG
jgi:hypothetical protein